MKKEGIEYFTLKSASLTVGLVAAVLFASALPSSEIQQGKAAETLTVAAVGDVMMGTTYPVNILPPDDGEKIFDGVADRLRNSDLLLGNLEGTLADSAKPMKCRTPLKGGCFEFVMPSRYVRHLKRAGFTVMNIANNHILDAGPGAAESTVDTLLRADIEAAGGEKVAVLKRGDKTVAVLGFSFNASPYAYSILDIAEAKEIIAQAKGQYDLVIVSFHGGAEGKDALHVGRGTEKFMGENRGDVVSFAHAAVDAGAAMVVGHGPHVLRALEIYKGKVIAYSLGNFLTFAVFNVKGPSGVSAILEARIDGTTGDFIAGRLIPIRLTENGIPAIDPSAEAIDLVRNLTSADIRPSSISIDPDGTIRPLKGM